MRTDRVIATTGPDIVLFNKRNKETFVTDVALHRDFLRQEIGG